MGNRHVEVCKQFATVIIMICRTSEEYVDESKLVAIEWRKRVRRDSATHRHITCEPNTTKRGNARTKGRVERANPHLCLFLSPTTTSRLPAPPAALVVGRSLTPHLYTNSSLNHPLLLLNMSGRGKGGKVCCFVLLIAFVCGIRSADTCALRAV